jgi:hypothetical protein
MNQQVVIDDDDAGIEAVENFCRPWRLTAGSFSPAGWIGI